MYCPKCGNKNKEGAKFCSACGCPMPRVNSSEADKTQAVEQATATDAPEVDAFRPAPQSDKLGSFLRKPVKFFGQTIPMFGAILAILLATAGIATAAFLIYQNTVAAQQQEQAQVVKTKKAKKKTVKKEETEQEEEADNATDKQEQKKPQQSVAQPDAAADSSAPASQEEQEATEEVEPPASSGQDQVTAPVANTYDPASEAGSWSGQMVAFNDGTSQLKKSGSYKEGVLACGRCYGATNQPLALTIASVDANSRTATGTVSFLLHAHNGPVDKDESSDSGDVYVQNVAFTAISIDGWRSSHMVDIYSGHGKTVQMSLRLKYGSTDDYSVWIRTVPTDPDPSKPGMYRWGQTDMYTIAKN